MTNRQNTHVLFEVAIQDVVYWRLEPMPVLLVVYDAQRGTAYWVHIQAYWQEFGASRLLNQQT
ncbi:MAG: DUF4365 domain-containing protein, partial [Bacteroidota bacterium]